MSVLLSVHRGGYPYPIMLCNITQNAMGQTPGGGGGGTRPGPAGGYPYPIMLCNITQNSMGQTPRWGTQPDPPGGGGTLPGQDGGTLPGVGGTQVGYPLGQVRTGGTQVGYPLAGYPPGQDGGYPGGGTLLGGPR